MVSQGAIAKLRGSDFRSGFIGGIVGGATTSWVAGKINLDISAATFGGRIARAAIGGVIGGISAKITGGRFEDGAVSAAFRYLFNDAAADAKRAEAVAGFQRVKYLDKFVKTSIAWPDGNTTTLYTNGSESLVEDEYLRQLSNALAQQNSYVEIREPILGEMTIGSDGKCICL